MGAFSAALFSGACDSSDSAGLDSGAFDSGAIDSGATDAALGADANDRDDAGSMSDAGSIEEAPIGWASVAGWEVERTTGGAGGRVVTTSDAAELAELAASDERLVIRVTGEITLAQDLRVSSDKTLIGEGATVHGGIRVRGTADTPVTNVILRNLRVNAATADEDGIQIYYAHHVWVDHCEIWDSADGLLDIVHASDLVTVSWTKFRYSTPAPAEDHRFAMLIGHDDPNEEDEGRLRVTLHHNWWAERVVERMPRVRYGDVHAFNNLHRTVEANNYGVRAAFEARVLLESNFFDRTETPHEIDGGEIVATDNVYEATTGAEDTAGAAFEPPYDYTRDDATDVRDLVMAGAGATL